MNHLGTVELHTPRLLLRRFTTDDAEAMFKNWCRDPEVNRFLTWPLHESVDVTKALLAGWTASYEKADYYHWVIVPKDIGEPIGSIGALYVKDDVRLVHVGYAIGKNWWRMGIMSETLARVIKFFFEDVGANRVEARHDPRNPNSGKVMAKCGMKYEGALRQAGRNNQGICDEVMYGILAEDYYNRKG